MSAQLFPAVKGLQLIVAPPIDTNTGQVRDDLSGIKVWYSTTTENFNVQTEGTLAYSGDGLNVFIPNLTPGTAYYVKYALISSLDETQFNDSETLTGTPLGGVVTVSLAVTDQAITYNDDGINPNPTSVTITASAKNTTGTVFYEFILNDQTVQHNSSTTYTYVPPTTYTNSPAQFVVKVREGSITNTVLAEDTITIFGLKPGKDGVVGKDAITVILSNDTHNFSADHLGVVPTNGYNASGTTIKVYSGATELTYDGVGVQNNTWKVVVNTEFNITKGQITSNGNTVIIGDHSNFSNTQNTAYIVYSITGNSNGTIFNVDKTQTFSKSKAGEDGTDGTDGEDGKDAITVLLSNETHSFTSDKDGLISSSNYAGSGTIIRVFSGATELPYDSTGTLNSSWQITNTSANNIFFANGNPIQYGTYSVTIPDHSSFSIEANTADVTYTISGKANGVSFSTTKSQTFSKSKAGERGTDGLDAISVLLSNETHSFTSNNAGEVSTYVGSGTTIRVFAGATELTYNGVGTQESTWKVTVLSSLNISPSTTLISYDGNSITYGDHSNFTTASDTANIFYQIQGTRAGTAFTIFKSQRFSKSKTGAKGDDGISSITVVLSNETHSLGISNTGFINFTGSGTEIRVFAGVTELQYEGAGNTNVSNNSWKQEIEYLNVYPGYVSDAGSYAVMSDLLNIVTGSKTGYINYKITGKYNNNPFQITKTQTFTVLEGGESPHTCRAVALQNYFVYNDNGVSPSPSTTQIQAYLVKGTDAITSVAELETYSFLIGLIDKNGNSTIVQQGSSNQYTYTPPANFNDFPQTLAVIVFYANDLSDPIAVDTLALTAIKPGKDGIVGKNPVNVILSNDSHPFTSGTAGNVLTYSGSGTQIEVYSGVTKLIYDGVGTTEGTWKVEILTGDAVNITAGSITGASSSSTTATVGNHQGFPDAQSTASITYTITGKSDGVPFTIKKTQKFSKSLKGADGQTGQAALPTYSATLLFQQKTIQYSAIGTDPLPATQYISAYLSENGVIISDPELIYNFFQLDQNGSATGLQSNNNNILSFASPATFTQNNQIQIAVTIIKVVNGQTLFYALDQESLNSIMPGLSGISVDLSNNTHILPTDSAGDVTDYSGATTEIRVYTGTGLVTYDGVGTANNTWKISSIEANNITAGSATIGASGQYAIVSAPSGFTTGAGLTGSIKFNIQGIVNNQAFSGTKTQTIIKSEPGRDAITALISKDTHSFTTNTSNQVIDYANSGAIIKVLAGTTELIYNGVGTTNGTWTVTATGTGITAGTPSGSGPTATQAVIGNHSGFPDAGITAKVTYTISGKYNDIPFFITKEQTFSKSKTGAQGDPGKALSVSTSSPFFLFPEWSTFYPITAEYSYDKGTGVETVFNALLSYPQLQNAATIGKIYIFRYGTQADRYIRTLGKVNLADYTVISYKVMTGGANASTGASWGELPDAADNLVLEYSTDLSNWTVITTHSPQTSLRNAWNTITTTLPAGAKTSSGVYLRFRQVLAESNADTWAITPPEIVKYPSSISINTIGTNLAGSPSAPQIISGNITLTGSSYPYTLNYNTTSVLPVILRVTWDGLSQDVEVGVTYESTAGISGSLTNDNVTIATSNTGFIYPTDARAVYLDVDTNTLSWNKQVIYAGVFNDFYESIPANRRTIFTATTANTQGTVYYEFLVNGVSIQNTTSNTYTWLWPTYAQFTGSSITVVVKIRENSSSGTVLSEDSVIIYKRTSAESTKLTLTNESAVLIPVDSTGTVTDFSKAVGKAAVTTQTGSILTNPAFRILTKSKVDATIDATTGNFSITNIFDDSGFIVIVADNYAYVAAQTFTVTKAKIGGNVFQAASGVFNVEKELETITGNGEVFYTSNTVQGNIGFNINSTTGEYLVTSLDSSAAVNLRAVYRGVVLQKLFTITKIKTGLNYLEGIRGASTAYISGQTQWSDSVASNYFVSRFGSLVIADTATLYGNNFTETKFWDGNSWTEAGQIIDGNLLVTGTIGTNKLAANSITAEKIASNQVTASKIDSRGLSIKDEAGNIILASGTSLKPEYINSISNTVNLINNSAFKKLNVTNTLPDSWTIYNPNNYNTPIGSVIQNSGLFSTNILRITNGSNSIPQNQTIGIQVSGTTYGPNYVDSTSYHTISFYARSLSANTENTNFSISATGFTTVTAISTPGLNTEWQRYSWKVISGSTVFTNKNLIISLVTRPSGWPSSAYFEICGLQVELAQSATAYSESAGDRIGPGNPITGTNISTFIQSAAIDSAYIKDAAITSAKIGNLAVTSAKIQDGSISTAKIGNLQVETLKIGENAVSVPRGGLAAAYNSGLVYGGNWAYRDILTFIPDINGKGVITIGMAALGFTFSFTGNPSVIGVRFAQPGETNTASWNVTRISFIRTQNGVDTEIITTGNFQYSFWDEFYWYIIHDTVIPGVPVTYKFGGYSNQGFILQSPLLSYFIFESKKMKEFIVYTQQGEILSSGTCLENEFELQGPLVIEGRANPSTQYIKNGEIKEKGMQPSIYYRFNYDLETWQDVRTPEEKWQQIREQRDKLLAETDWMVIKAQESGTQVPEAWRQYRQALRDITTQTNPDNITWPQKPQ